jgi:hypothetical protein
MRIPTKQTSTWQVVRRQQDGEFKIEEQWWLGITL